MKPIKAEDCPKHYKTGKLDETLVCGCPYTKRRNGLLVFKMGTTGNWVVWDVQGWTWLSLCGDWQTAMNTAHEYISHYPPEPIRCASRCSQWPNCQHDWREWHKVILPQSAP